MRCYNGPIFLGAIIFTMFLLSIRCSFKSGWGKWKLSGSGFQGFRQTPSACHGIEIVYVPISCDRPKLSFCFHQILRVMDGPFLISSPLRLLLWNLAPGVLILNDTVQAFRGMGVSAFVKSQRIHSWKGEGVLLLTAETADIGWGVRPYPNRARNDAHKIMARVFKIHLCIDWTWWAYDASSPLVHMKGAGGPATQSVCVRLLLGYLTNRYGKMEYA